MPRCLLQSVLAVMFLEVWQLPVGSARSLGLLMLAYSLAPLAFLSRAYHLLQYLGVHRSSSCPHPRGREVASSHPQNDAMSYLNAEESKLHDRRGT